ncbi:MAG: tyrosine-type recombinase/integrase [Planctomycetes bacterium]|nr:tyrosine-type recombinase/integrase [Planctomycetota bacterium]
MARLKKLTWGEVEDLFRTHLRARNLSPKSVYCYCLEVSRLADHLRPLRPSQVRTEDLRDYQVGLLSGTASRSGNPLSGRNVYRVTCNLATFFRWLLDHNGIGKDPTARLERPKQNQPLQGNVLTVDETSRLLGAAEATNPVGLRDRAMVELLYATGLRRAELIGLDLGDFNRRERLLDVRHGKGDKARQVPLTRAACLRLEVYLKEGRPQLAAGPSEEALFVTRFGLWIAGRRARAHEAPAPSGCGRWDGQAGDAAHAEADLRDAPPPERRQLAAYPDAPRTREALDDRALPLSEPRGAAARDLAAPPTREARPVSKRLSQVLALELLKRQRIQRARAHSSIVSEQRLLRRLLPRLGKRLDRVTVGDVERWLATRLTEVCATTVGHELSSLRKLFEVLVSEGHVQRDPTTGLSVKQSPPRRLVLSEGDVGRLLVESSRLVRARRPAERSAAIALRNRALLELLYSLGIRAGEVVQLRLLDLDLAGRTIFARRVKGGRGAALPLPESLVPHVERYVTEARPELLSVRDEAKGLLLVNERGRPLACRDVWRTVNKVAKRAGFAAHPHALRRSVATHLVRDGASLFAVQELLGHKRLDTTQRYVGVEVEELRASRCRRRPRQVDLSGGDGSSRLSMSLEASSLDSDGTPSHLAD